MHVRLLHAGGDGPQGAAVPLVEALPDQDADRKFQSFMGYLIFQTFNYFFFFKHPGPVRDRVLPHAAGPVPADLRLPQVDRGPAHAERRPVHLHVQHVLRQELPAGGQATGQGHRSQQQPAGLQTKAGTGTDRRRSGQPAAIGGVRRGEEGSLRTK